MKVLDSQFTTLKLMGKKYSLLYLSKKPLMQKSSFIIQKPNLSQLYINSEILKIQKEYDSKKQKEPTPRFNNPDQKRERSFSVLSRHPRKLPHLPIINLQSISPQHSMLDITTILNTHNHSQLLPDLQSPKRPIKLNKITMKQKKEQRDDKEKALEDEITNIEKQMHREDRQRLLNGVKVLERKRMNIIKKIYDKKKLKKIEYGRNLTCKLDNINYTRESLEKLADNNSMRYFDSYKKFMREYHQQIVMGLLAPSSKLKFRMDSQKDKPYEGKSSKSRTLP